MKENIKFFTNTLIQITQNGMGIGDEALGEKLLVNYLNLIKEEQQPPKFVALYNSGVKIVCEGSNAIAAIKDLESMGVKFIACKTCLNEFALLDKMKAGIVGSMMDIIELQKMATKVITL